MLDRRVIPASNASPLLRDPAEIDVNNGACAIGLWRPPWQAPAGKGSADDTRAQTKVTRNTATASICPVPITGSRKHDTAIAGARTRDRAGGVE